MESATTIDYNKVLSEVIKKQIVIFGPDITFAKIRNIPGFTADANGIVIESKNSFGDVILMLIEQFSQLSEFVVKKTIEPMMSDYPQFSGLLIHKRI